MVFSSIPAYLDPANWQQQSNNQSGGSNQAAGTHHFAPPPPPPPPPHPHGSGGAGSIRPGSMADRARLANIPMPEAALRCPRCESTNTKFCYFNNYSLSQPRHFCKTCRRYWTRGGALRNVPVGGGCRRNKRSKGTSSSNNSASKSPASSDGRQTASGSASTMSSGTSCDILGFGPQIPPLRFMAPLHHLTSNDFSAGDIGLNYGSNISALGGNDLNFHIGSAFASAASGGSILGGGATSASSLLSSLGGLDQWRLQQAQQQIPFLGGLDSSSSNPGLYGYDHGGILEGSAVYGGGSSQVRGKMPSSGVLSQFASVKMEDSNSNQQQELNLSRQFLGLQGNNDNHHHYNWNINSSTTAGAAATAAAATAWTDLSSFNSSSNTSDPL